MDFGSVAAGVVAYGLSVVASVLLVFGTYRLNTVLIQRSPSFCRTKLNITHILNADWNIVD